MSRFNNGIALPNTVNVAVKAHDNGMAHPISFGIGTEYHIFGGMTKLECVAAQQVPAVLAIWDRSELVSKPEEVTPIIAAVACNLAEALIAECAKRQQAKLEAK